MHESCSFVLEIKDQVCLFFKISFQVKTIGLSLNTACSRLKRAEGKISAFHSEFFVVLIPKTKRNDPHGTHLFGNNPNRPFFMWNN